MKNFSTIAKEYHTGMGQLADAIPKPVNAFHNLVGAATQGGALSTKTKELIAFGIAISVRCDGCSRQEVAEMIGVAVLMGGGPSSVYGVEAIQAYDEFANAKAA